MGHKFFQLMKSSPEYNYLQYVLACAMQWYDMYIICIEMNKHRMIIYNKIGRDNIRKKRRINNFGDVCWFFRSFRQFVNLLESLIYLKACKKIVEFSWYVRKSLPFVSSFISIVMIEGSQLRLSNNISLLSVYLSQSKKKWWEFSHGAPQLQEAFDNILTLHQS